MNGYMYVHKEIKIYRASTCLILPVAEANSVKICFTLIIYCPPPASPTLSQNLVRSSAKTFKYWS